VHWLLTHLRIHDEKRKRAYFSWYALLQALINPVGKRCRVPPVNTVCGTDQATCRFFIIATFFDAQVALHGLGDFMVKLHDTIRAGLYTAGTARDTPLCFLDGHVFCKS